MDGSPYFRCLNGLTAFKRVSAPSQDVSGLRVRFNQGTHDVMNGLLQLELTSEERDVLLRGLRYVRSALMLEMREPSKEDERRRSGRLDEIQNLCQRLESADLRVRV